jgi:hypothetical protein
MPVLGEASDICGVIIAVTNGAPVFLKFVRQKNWRTVFRRCASF